MSAESARWYDLFSRRGTRRDFLRVGGSVAGLVALGALPGCGGRPRPRFTSDPFQLGVAAGDPAPHGVVLWTRLDAGALEDAGSPSEPMEVGWEIAGDESFSRTLRAGTAEARPELGHSVHVEVQGPGAGPAPAMGIYRRLPFGQLLEMSVISSGGDGADMTAGGARVLADNPHIKFYNGQRGDLRAAVTRSAGRRTSPWYPS